MTHTYNEMNAPLAQQDVFADATYLAMRDIMKRQQEAARHSHLASLNTCYEDATLSPHAHMELSRNVLPEGVKKAAIRHTRTRRRLSAKAVNSLCLK